MIRWVACIVFMLATACESRPKARPAAPQRVIVTGDPQREPPPKAPDNVSVPAEAPVDARPAPGVEAESVAAPASEPAPTRRDAREKLKRELERLRALEAQRDRATSRMERARPRVEALERAARVTAHRAQGLAGVVWALGHAETAPELFRIEAFGSGWTMVLDAEGEDDVVQFAAALARVLSIPSVQQAPYPERGRDSWRLGFAYPRPRPVPGGPAAAGTPEAAAEEQALRREVDVLAARVTLDDVLAARDAALAMMEREKELNDRYVTGMRQRRSLSALMACAQSAGLQTVRTDPPRLVRHAGVGTERHDLRGVGTLQEVERAVDCLSDTGALLGVTSINRIKRAGRYRLRVELHVARP